MLVGKTQAAVDALVRMIAERRVHRIYVALAHGALKQPEVWVDQPLGRDPRNRLRMAVQPAHSTSAKAAQTTVRLLARSDAYSWVGCKLHTGRTHQIRVHMRGWATRWWAMWCTAVNPCWAWHAKPCTRTGCRCCTPSPGKRCNWKRHCPWM